MLKQSIIYSLFGYSLLYLMTSCQPTQNTSSEKPTENRPYMHLFIGTASGKVTEGIYTLKFYTNDGSFEHQQKRDNILNPGFLAISPDKKFLYSTHALKDQKEGGVSAFSVNTETGSLNLLNQQTSRGRGPCYISIDPTGKWVFVANYSSGSVTVFPVKENGSLGEATDVQQHVGSSINKERQEGPHAHYIRYGAGGKIYAADLGTDEVRVYDFDAANGKLMPASEHIKSAPGLGPRHVDYHPNEKYVYVMNELGGSVSVYDASNFQEIQTISSLPEGFSGYNKSADIHVHPSGKFLYASNRGDYDSIAIFEVDQHTGKLSLIAHQDEGIVWPRNFAISPDGKFLIVANRNDNSLLSFRIDPQSGALVPSGQKIEIPAPICVLFGISWN